MICLLYLQLYKPCQKHLHLVHLSLNRYLAKIWIENLSKTIGTLRSIWWDLSYCCCDQHNRSLAVCGFVYYSKLYMTFLYFVCLRKQLTTQKGFLFFVFKVRKSLLPFAIIYTIERWCLENWKCSHKNHSIVWTKRP